MRFMKNLNFIKNSVIAHRGIFDNKVTIENTIKAFKKAINKNMTIELDVHLTKDNKIVVYHDDNLSRLTNSNKNIKDLTYDEIKNIKFKETDDKIPTLNEVLDIIDGKVPVIIELKYDTKNHKLEKELVKILDNYKGEFAVQSFDYSIINWFKKNRENYIRGLLVTNKKDNLFKYLNNKLIFLNLCKPDFLSVNKKNLGNKKIEEYNKNHPVIAYTIKNKKDYNKYKNEFDNLICENMNNYIEKEKI